ncbi:MAG TPA: hypothetical protein VFW11_16770 [Cyclobacteriaceae bacterium]|nr:hypothetical protein [Cyclobacteriaceae bacterium]
MLESISWQEYFSTTAWSVGGYYLITILLLYSSEIAHIFKQKRSTPSDIEIRKDQNRSNESKDLMGGIRHQSRDQHVLREDMLDAQQLSVAPSNRHEDPIDSADFLGNELRKDLSSIRSSINSLAELSTQGTREDSILLFRTLISNYPQFVGTPYQEEVTELIYASCTKVHQLHFKRDEINSWWPSSSVTSKNNQ